MTDITIEDDLETAIVERIEQTHFESVEEYVNFALREIMNADSTAEDDGSDRNTDVQDQLEDLGYL